LAKCLQTLTQVCDISILSESKRFGMVDENY